MAWDEENDSTIYTVVVNDEEQYSLWPADRENPLGWRDVGKSGPNAECLTYIEAVWTDMRPVNLRQHMEETAHQPGPPLPPPSAPDDTAEVPLVERLAQSRHPIIASLYPDKSVQGLKESIDRGYVHIKFTATRGGMELGVRLDTAACDFSQAEFENQTGTTHLEGGLTLDYVKVRCIADIDLTTLAGQGHLEIVEA
jgi:uncharacterized protein YbdZ (MbtH family)